MDLSPLATSNNAFCWNAMDFSDCAQGRASQFAVRFKTQQQYNEFLQIFNDCKEKLKQPHPEASVDSNSVPVAAGPVVEEPPAETRVWQEHRQASASTSSDDDEEDDDDDDSEVVLEKRCSLEVFDNDAKMFKNVGVGELRIVYDDSVYGYHITMRSDEGRVLCDHIIAVQTSVRTEGKRATWAGLDLSLEPVAKRQFRVAFNSAGALKEFADCVEEGKEIALKAGIVEHD